MFRLEWNGNFMKFYVGEGKDLAVRTGQYRNHLSCRRVRKAIHQWLSAEGWESPTGEREKEVRLWVAYDSRVLVEGAAPGEWTPSPLNHQAHRLMAEAVAVGQELAYAGTHVETLNRFRVD